MTATHHLRIGTTSAILIEASDTADLLVAGAHRADDAHGLSIGPVANILLHHSACPVAIVPMD